MTKNKKGTGAKSGQNIKENLCTSEKNDNVEDMESPFLCEVPSKCVISIAVFLKQSGNCANHIKEDGILEDPHDGSKNRGQQAYVQNLFFHKTHSV